MSVRAFAVGEGLRGLVAYDPCSGVTRTVPRDDLAHGRHYVEDCEVSEWPIIHPSEAGRVAPVSICWSPIVSCNLRCPHCLDDKSLPDGNPELRVRIVEIIVQSGLLGVDISGGEPLLLPDLPDLIDRLVNGGLVASVTTNGWSLGSRASELARRVDAVRISLDGAGAERHDRWRGVGSFVRAVGGVRACARLGIPVQIQTVAMRSTVRGLQELLDLAAAEGAKGVTISQMLPIGEGVNLAGRELLSDDEVEHVVSELRVPASLAVRLRKRQDAAGFTIVRADGSIWRNGGEAQSIRRIRPLVVPEDMSLQNRPDGSA